MLPCVSLSVLLLLALSWTAYGDQLKYQPSENDVVKWFDTATNLTELRNGNKDWPPTFCRKLGCPKYKVVETKKDYEVRVYDMTHWVTTSVAGVNFAAAEYMMFMKLFKYIQGYNVKGQVIEMTTPVKVRIIPGPGPTCESNFTMSFFMDPTIGSPPAPKDSTLDITSMRSMKVFVRSFGGFANLQDWLQQATALAAALPSSARYETGYYYTAGYDAPFQIFKRHNEVWFLAK